MDKLEKLPLNQNLFKKTAVTEVSQNSQQHIICRSFPEIHSKTEFLVYKFLPQKRHQHSFKK